MPNYHTFREWPKLTLGVTLKKTFKKPKKPKGGFNDPTDIPDLVLWLDGSDVSTMWQDPGRSTPVTTDGQTVAVWDDKSGNGNGVEQTGANNEPAYRTGIQNGLSILRCALGATPDHMFRTSTVLTQDQDVTVFYVGANTNDEYVSGVYSNGLTSGNALSVFIDSQNATRDGIQVKDSTGFAIADIPSDIGTAFNQFTALITGGNLQASLNSTVGTAVPYAGDGVTANDYTYVMAQRAAFSNMEGDLGELIVYDAALTNGQIKAVEKWLKAKWATP